MHVYRVFSKVWWGSHISLNFKGSLLFGDSSVDISENKKPYRVLNIALLKWGFNKFGVKSIFVICDAYSVYCEIGWEDWLFI